LVYDIFNLMSQERIRDNERPLFEPIKLQAEWGQTIHPLESLSPEVWALLGQPRYYPVDGEASLFLTRDAQTITVNFTDIEPDGPAAIFNLTLAPLDQGLAVALLDIITLNDPRADIPLAPLGLDFHLTATPDGTIEGSWSPSDPIFVMGPEPSWVSSEFIGEETQWEEQYELSEVSFTMVVGQAKIDWTPKAGDVLHGEQEKGASVLGFKTEVQINDTPVQPESLDLFLPHNDQVPKLISLTAHQQI
jgi:hypothetical protein